jgi:L-aminopeptidase/D-esterase-like protein
VLKLVTALVLVAAQAKPRARELGVPFDGTPGALNAITDVAGVEVGQVTLVEGQGRKAVRTGVTAVFPRGKEFRGRVFAGIFSLNGNGEMTGAHWVEESGCLGTPVVVTNTHSVGVVRDAVIEWSVRGSKREGYSGDVSLPVVAETWDGFLNDINGFHVKKEHVFQALDAAKGGPVAEGNVGGGTGMVVHGFKGGIGTASRKAGEHTLGVLVQANYGGREQLRVAGVPVGREIPDLQRVKGDPDKEGSIIIVAATDAPLLPHQLKRIARRAAMGLARVGSTAGNSSGDLFIAFSTANAAEVSKEKGAAALSALPNDVLNPLFEATAQATEEAIVNAMVAAEDMVGVNGNRVFALPHDRLRAALRKYGRLKE